jgi:hypothetical protein
MLSKWNRRGAWEAVAAALGKPWLGNHPRNYLRPNP